MCLTHVLPSRAEQLSTLVFQVSLITCCINILQCFIQQIISVLQLWLRFNHAFSPLRVLVAPNVVGRALISALHAWTPWLYMSKLRLSRPSEELSRTGTPPDPPG